MIPRLIRIIRRWRPNVLHVHDLPGSLPYMLAAKLFGIPIIVDLHEDWPDLVVLNTRRRGIISRILARFVAILLKLEERVVLMGADALVTVLEELAEEFARMGADPYKVVVIHNAADIEEMDREVGDLIDLKKEEGMGIRIVYVGGIGFHRDLRHPFSA